MKVIDLTGQTFGELYVVGFSEVSRNGHKRYHVRCSCGVEKTVFGMHLLHGKIKSCGHLRNSMSKNFQGVGSVGMTYWNALIANAAGRKGRKPLPFDLTLEYIADLLDNRQNGKCALTGLSISVKGKTASLDRIDSSQGYVVGNVQWVHKDINMMKRHYTMDYFRHLCHLVSSCEIVDIGA